MITLNKNFDDKVMTVWCLMRNFEHHLTIFPWYISSIEKGENDTHSHMNVAYNWGVPLLAFSDPTNSNIFTKGNGIYFVEIPLNNFGGYDI